MTLPTYLIDAPHSADAKDVVLDSVESGRVIQGKKKKNVKKDYNFSKELGSFFFRMVSTTFYRTIFNDVF